MQTNKRRPAAQRSHNLRLTSSEYNQERYGMENYEIAKSEPDLLDSKYVEYRRPWYVNPEYQGPVNNMLCFPQSDGFYNTKSTQDLSTENRLEWSSSRLSKSNRNILTNQNSITDTPRFEKSTYFSYENIIDSQDHVISIPNHNIFNNSIPLSSSPESSFSIQYSSTGSSEKQNHPYMLKAHLAQNPLPNPVKGTMKNEIRRKCYSTSPKCQLQNMDRAGNFEYSNRKHIASSAPKSRSNLNINKIDYKRSLKNYGQCADPSDVFQWSPTPVSEFKRGPRPSDNLSSCIQPFKNSECYALASGYDANMRKQSHSCSSHSTGRSSFASVSNDSGYPRFACSNDYSDALFRVFTYLDTKSLAMCGAVCKQWSAICKEPVLWRRIRMKNCQISPNTFKCMSQWSTKVKEINLQNISYISESAPLNSKFEHCGIPIETSLEKLIEINKETLQTLRIVDCDSILTGRIFWTVSIHCKKLNKLVYLSRINPLRQDDLFPLGKGCPHITALIIPPGWPPSDDNKFDDASCETIAKCWPKLQVLCIGGRYITIAGLSHISKGCIKLQQLEIDHGPEITEEITSKMVAYGLRGLEKLDFTFTPVSPRAIVIFNSACPRLDHIGIHCRISDYFTNPNSSKAKANFNSLKTLFKRLKSRTGFSKILDVNLEYDPNLEK